MEIWKDVPNYEGYYEASTHGRIRNKITNKLLKPIIQKNGYAHCSLYKNKKCKQLRWHRVIATTFLANPDNKESVNHIDECKTNNRVSNLEWCTHKENNNHGNHIENVARARRIYIQCSNGNIYHGVNQAGLALDICPQNISKVLKGKRKTAGGFSFSYLEESV